MTKSELIDAIAARAELPRARAEQVVNLVFDAMIEAMVREEGIGIRGFGSFRTRKLEARMGRNPRTAAPVSIPARRAPAFKVGKDLRELVQNSRTLLRVAVR
ncbi:MAG: HU family DNA-binding protein [Polyangiaceae bacterium]